MNTEQNYNKKEKALRIGSVTHRFSVGETVNYCNGMLVKIAKINEENGVCYDSNGMWYALVNCKPISNGG